MSRVFDALRDALRNALLAVTASLVAAPLAAQTMLSPSEVLSAWDRVVMEATFSKADLNDDGLLTRSEAQRLAAFSERFDALDVNRDSSLDLEEFAAGFALAH